MVPSIPSAIIERIQVYTDSTFIGFTFSSGGCINHRGKLTTSDGVYFLKWNDLKKFPGMFAAEAKGLRLLRDAGALVVPEVIYVDHAGAYQFLLLEYIPSADKGRDYWEQFGRGLATLHKKSAQAFGLDHNNYIGSLPQRNTPSPSWVEFFIEQRLAVQLHMAVLHKRIDNVVVRKFDSLYRKLPEIFPEESPALLHGDVWGGNIMTGSAGNPCLIDPAVYYGHREADLAMTQLFGGFHPSFLDHYEEEYPLQPGWEERLDVYNLYPLLVHVNLFGGGYSGQVLSILKRFVGST